MKILALQLKRIGDVILTTPALVALRRAFPDAHLTLAVAGSCGELLPALPFVDEGLVFHRGRLNAASWPRILGGGFDVCLDFTGNDRSALATLLSRAARRATFAWVGKSKLRSLAYNRFIDSAVREHHTVDHYGNLLRAFDVEGSAPLSLHLPAAVFAAGASALSGVEWASRPLSAEAALRAKALGETPRTTGGTPVPPIPNYVVIHPGTARAEKFWLAERWAAVIEHLGTRLGLECVLTGGADPFEREHLAKIQKTLSRPCADLSGKLDLLGFAGVIQRSRAVLSCDTAAVHFAAAFEKPQLALYGPTNPFHWRPRHARSVVLSAAHPDAPLTHFTPKMKGAAMAGLSTELVTCATDALLRGISD